MPKSDEYRQCAAECVKLAAKATDLHDKALLLAMAENELHPKSMWFSDLLVLGPATEPPSSLTVR